jgi:hypothetical protein
MTIHHCRYHCTRTRPADTTSTAGYRGQHRTTRTRTAAALDWLYTQLTGRP